MKSYPFIISCDWFALSCSCEAGHSPNIADEIVYTGETDAKGYPISVRRISPNLGQKFRTDDCPYTFIVCETTEHHPFYESSALIKVGNTPVAHIFYRCKRAGMPFSCQVKVDNSRLYFEGWSQQTLALIKALGWHVISVNRIDVCADFNLFANGRAPLRFCQDYLSDPTASRCSFIRHSSNKVRAVLTRRLGCVEYHTLSWGTRDSAVQVNLYNKSLELQEKVNKPWILQRWTQGGLVHDPKGEFTGKPQVVWRVEFSLNPAAVCFKNLRPADAAVREIGIHDVDSPVALLMTFRSLLPAYFKFHELWPSDVASDRKVKDLREVTLFNVGALPEEYGDAVPYKPLGVRYFRKSTRTDRMLLNRLLDSYESDGLSAEERAAFNVVIHKLIEVYQEREDIIKDINLADDVLQEWLQSALAPKGCIDKSATASSSVKRAASRWVRMLKGVHDPSLDAFAEALMYLETLEDTDAFQSCLKFAQKVSCGPMPNEAVEDFIEQDIQEAYLQDRAELDMLVPDSAKYTPQDAEDYNPI